MCEFRTLEYVSVHVSACIIERVYTWMDECVLIARIQACVRKCVRKF